MLFARISPCLRRELSRWNRGARIVSSLMILIPAVTTPPTAKAESAPRVVAYEQDFDIDLETLALHHGWILPQGQAKASIEEDADRQGGVLVLRLPKEGRQYAKIRVPIEPRQSYAVSYALRADHVTTREWPVSVPDATTGKADADTDWQVLSPGDVFVAHRLAGMTTLRMRWSGHHTQPARAVHLSEDARQVQNGVIRALMQVRQHGAASPGFAAGVLLRQQGLEGEKRDQNYYVYLSGTGELIVAKNSASGWNGKGEILGRAKVDVPARNDRARPYLLEINSHGSRIAARILQSARYGAGSYQRLCAAKDRLATFREVAAEVAVEDTTYSSGLVGVAGYSSGGNKSVDFIELDVTAEGPGGQDGSLSILPHQRGAVVLAHYVSSTGEILGRSVVLSSVWGTSKWREYHRNLSGVAPEKATGLQIELGVEGSGTACFDALCVLGSREELDRFSPASSAVVDELRPQLSWQGAFPRYRVELSRTRDFSGEVRYVYTTASEIRPNRALEPGDWYWRVRPWRPERAGYRKGNTGPVRSFTVAEDASPWPPAVWPTGHVWASGPRRPFDVRVSPLRPDFSVDVQVEGASASLIRTDGEMLTFVPGSDLKPGVHSLRVAVTDTSTQQTKHVDGILNNVVPANVSKINEYGVTEVNGKPFFPIGGFRDPSNKIDEFDGAVEAGWNMIFSYYSAESDANAQAFLDGAKANGLYVMIRHPGGWGHKDDRDLCRARWVARYSAHPALLAWYLGDEPELYGYTPLCVQRMAEVLSETDPNTVTTMVSHFPDAHGRFGDVFMPMSYVLGPFFGHSPDEPLDARSIYRMNRPRQGIARVRDLTNSTDGKQRPLWVILQGADPRYSRYIKNRDDTLEEYGPMLRPTYQETRCMAFTALSYDVQGIFWWYSGSFDIRIEAPNAWDGIVRTSKELRSLEEFLVRPPTPEDRLDMPEPLLVWTRQVGCRRILAIINPISRNTAAEIDLSKYGTQAIRPRNQRQDIVSLSDGRTMLEFAPHEVKVFEITMGR